MKTLLLLVFAVGPWAIFAEDAIPKAYGPQRYEQTVAESPFIIPRLPLPADPEGTVPRGKTAQKSLLCGTWLQMMRAPKNRWFGALPPKGIPLLK